MSSSNLVRIIGIPETTYGLTPALGPATEVLPIRFTSESLSGTPQTTESQEARTDRMSGGQVVTGLNSGGDISGELSQYPAMDQIISMAMMMPWSVPVSYGATSLTQTKVAGNDQLADWVLSVDLTSAPPQVGDLLTVDGFTNAVNNGPRQVVSVTLPSTVRVTVPRASTDEAIAAAVIAMPAYVDIGDDVISMTLSKSYEDVTHAATTDVHSQRYTGALVNQLAVNMTWGEIVTSTATFVANGYLQEAPSLAQQVIAAGGTVPPAPTDQPLNGSVDMPMVTVGGQPTDYCIQSLNFTLNNNLTPQTCLGKIAPTKYSQGTAAINVTANIYLGDPSYDAFMPAKLTQQPVSMLFAAENADGGYVFDFRAVQLSFPDPSSGGRDQQVLINATGVAKVGPNGTSALRIYRL